MHGAPSNPSAKPGVTSKLTCASKSLGMLKGPKPKPGIDHSPPFHPSPNVSFIVSVQTPELEITVPELSLFPLPAETPSHTSSHETSHS